MAYATLINQKDTGYLLENQDFLIQIRLFSFF